jgi:hypothetical protein
MHFIFHARANLVIWSPSISGGPMPDFGPCVLQACLVGEPRGREGRCRRAAASLEQLKVKDRSLVRISNPLTSIRSINPLNFHFQTH